MPVKFATENGQLTLLRDGSWVPASARDYVEASKAEGFEGPALEITSFGRLQLRLHNTQDLKPKISLEIVADKYTVRLEHETRFPLNHLVSDDFLIPIRESDANRLNDLIEQESILGDAISLRELKGLIRIWTTHGFLVNFEPEALEQFGIELDQSVLDLELPLELWPYQIQGVQWLASLWAQQVGGILADEMGLGKTIQLLALVAWVLGQREESNPVLIVTPGTLLLNWCKEIEDKFPQIAAEAHVHFGGKRSTSPEFLKQQALILTTYDVLVRDVEFLERMRFSTVICDEAHWLRNPNTLKNRAVSALDARSKILVSGTFIQNRTLDFWALADLANPGLLGHQEDFLLTADNSPSEAEALVQAYGAFVLRRTQAEVGIQIPDWIETWIPMNLVEDERQEYQELWSGNHPETTGLKIEQTLSARRQFCCHPSSFSDHSDPKKGEKATFVLERLEQIAQSGEKAILFAADFHRPLDLYAELVETAFPSALVVKIDGRVSMPERFGLVEQFSARDGFAVLVINPAVGGEGLNIIAANHVFHLNPAWNPAKTDQASFRVVRPGQERKTHGYHLYFEGTVEEHIYQVVTQKREISEAALQQAEVASKAKAKFGLIKKSDDERNV